MSLAEEFVQFMWHLPIIVAYCVVMVILLRKAQESHP